MKIINIAQKLNALAIGSLLFASFTVSAANLYVGAGVGQSEYDDFGTDASGLDDGSIIAADINDTDTGIRLFIGAGINPNLSIELGYVDLGEFTIDAISDGSGFLYAPGDVSLDIPADGVDLSFIGKLPVGTNGSLNLRVGFLMWDAKAKLADTTGSISVSDDGNDIFFAFGGEYRFTEQLGLRGEYAIYDLDGTDVNLLSASLAYYLDK
jgi:OOP family OmpA-OmpF porin